MLNTEKVGFLFFVFTKIFRNIRKSRENGVMECRVLTPSFSTDREDSLLFSIYFITKNLYVSQNRKSKNFSLMAHAKKRLLDLLCLGCPKVLSQGKRRNSEKSGL